LAAIVHIVDDDVVATWVENGLRVIQEEDVLLDAAAEAAEELVLELDRLLVFDLALLGHDVAFGLRVSLGSFTLFHW
jgi:hypothetical protein